MTIQPMPALTEEQYDALREDIATNGVLVPVVFDQHGRVIDGNNRKAIADELGIDYPRLVREVADDDDAWTLALTLNCARRHLSREQRREVIRAEIERRPDDSDRAIARRVGCDHKTVGAVRREGGEIPQAQQMGREEAIEYTEAIRDQLKKLATNLLDISFLLISHGVPTARVVRALTLGEVATAKQGIAGVVVSIPWEKTAEVVTPWVLQGDAKTDMTADQIDDLVRTLEDGFETMPDEYFRDREDQLA